MSERRITHQEWQARGRELFGDNVNLWLFICPSCGQVQNRLDWLAYGTAQPEADRRLGFDCIGIRAEEVCPGSGAVDFMERSAGAGCLYTSAGLFPISPVTIEMGTAEDPFDRPVFAFYHHKEAR